MPIVDVTNQYTADYYMLERRVTRLKEEVIGFSILSLIIIVLLILNWTGILILPVFDASVLIAALVWPILFLVTNLLMRFKYKRDLKHLKEKRDRRDKEINEEWHAAKQLEKEEKEKMKAVIEEEYQRVLNFIRGNGRKEELRKSLD